MAQMFKKGFKAKSTTKKAKGIIRSEILNNWASENFDCLPKNATRLDKFHCQAESANCGDNRRHSDYEKAKYLVDGGSMRCYYSDQAEFLKKIYGSNVDKWNGDKIHNTYSHLVGREYQSMMNNKRKRGN